MITEGYFAKIKDYPETDWLICVSRKYPFFVKKDKLIHLDGLSPSPYILESYKSGNWEWKKYEERFIREMRLSGRAMKYIAWIGLKDAHGQTVRLLCYERADDKRCHRFLLLKILKDLGANVQSSRGKAK